MTKWNTAAEEAYAATVQREREAERRGRGGRQPGSKNRPQPERHCQAPGCGVLFTPTRASQLYHSAACKQRAWRAAHGANTRTRTKLHKEES
jgi:hypothetical protein